MCSRSVDQHGNAVFVRYPGMISFSGVTVPSMLDMWVMATKKTELNEGVKDGVTCCSRWPAKPGRNDGKFNDA